MTNVDSSNTNRRAFLLIFGLVAANLLVWGWTLLTFQHNAELISTALLAYSYGIRHAVDADHIAAIDNVTRKLMQQGPPPVTIGAFFSLGHSSIVTLACVSIAAATPVFLKKLNWIHHYGSIAGTVISALFLLTMAVLNANVLCKLCRQCKQLNQKHLSLCNERTHPAQSGIVSRVFNSAFTLVNKSWQMYLIGFLFGLGFDTATEIGLLGISASNTLSGRSAWNILVFPALFAAGMSLVDSLDNLIMVGAYGWASDKTRRKHCYDITITSASVIMALFVGGTEATGLIARQFGLNGVIWTLADHLNDNMGYAGCAGVAILAVIWGVSALLLSFSKPPPYK